MEWLQREEEVVGFDATVRASVDMEEARRLLFGELGFEPTEAQLGAFQQAGIARYEMLPQLGVTHAMEEHWWGYQSTYRDIVTGRYVKPEDVVSALRTFF